VKAIIFAKTGRCGKGLFVMSAPRGSEYYHRRADELRTAAGEARSRDNRDTLLSFAAYFDGRADEAESAEEAHPEKAVAC
jgi:hypothetical protein